MTWDCHEYDSAKVRYDMILGIDLLTALGLNIKSSYHIIEADYGTCKGYMAPMVDLGTY